MEKSVLRNALIEIKLAKLNQLINTWAKENRATLGGSKFVVSLHTVRVRRRSFVARKNPPCDYAEMPPQEFFSTWNAAELGVSKPLVTRIRHALEGGQIWYMVSRQNIVPKTMSELVLNLSPIDVIRTPNIGRKAVEVMAEMIKRCLVEPSVRKWHSCVLF